MFFICSGEIQLTVLARHNFVESSTPPKYQCYYNIHDGVAGLEFGRTSPIPSASAPPPPSPGRHNAPKSLLRLSNASAEVVTFLNESAFGAFYCRAISGKDNETLTITALFTRSDGMQYDISNTKTKKEYM